MNRSIPVGAVWGAHLAVYASIWVFSALSLHSNFAIHPSVFVIDLAFSIFLIWISVHDFETLEIQDIASGSLVLTGLVSTKFLGFSVTWSLLGAAVWFSVFYAVSAIYRSVRGYDGLGMGDAKLMAGIGAWLGPVVPIYVVLFSALSAISLLLVSRIRGGSNSTSLRHSSVAFGPFICLSAWVTWLVFPNGSLI